ncbi:TRAP transporter small permease [Georgenia deserti]|uniref:TRAP transporter small permease n=1 Tax=Georgenia deserti TaxID=2093781 RepID=A0ABW4L2Z7_9MICO
MTDRPEDAGHPDDDGRPQPADDHEEPAEQAGSRFYHWLGRVELRFAQLCIVAMTVLVLTSAVARTIGSPMNWTVDLATFTFAWAVFVGADVTWRRNRMVSIGAVVERLPVRVQAAVAALNTVLIGLFLIAVVITGYTLAIDAADRSFDGIPALSYTWVTIAVPVGCALMLYTTAHKLADQLRTLRHGGEGRS